MEEFDVCKILRVDDQRYLSPRHASRFLDIPVGTLRKRYAAGHIKYLRDSFSKRIYFSKAELIRYMKRGEQKIVERNPFFNR